jgi:hypothetical protein
VPYRTLMPAIAILALLLASRGVLAEPRVELELVKEPGFSITGSHQWLAMLGEIGLENVRIRQGRTGDRAEIKSTGSGAATVHRVTGILTTDNKLWLPAGRFTMADRGRIAQWIERLKAGGEEELTTPRVVFGLSEKEFVELYERMSAPVAFSTKDQPAAECVKTLVRGLEMPVTTDDAARAALTSDWRLPDELQGVAQGTALAALLRPLGLAFAPHREIGGKISLKIVAPTSLEKPWPIGWPPEKNPRETAPDLFKFLNVEIADTPVSDALTAIQGRLEMPLLFDHNALTRERIDLTQVRGNMPGGRTYYKRIIDHLLFQAKLKSEVRLDEADRPFLWITSVKPR